jgi:hypothetical protein
VLRKQKNYKTLLDMQIKVAFRKRNTIKKDSKITSTNRQIREKYYLPNEMHGLPTEIRRANRENILYQIYRTCTDN